MILHLDCVPMKPHPETGVPVTASTPEEYLIVLRQHRNVMLSQTDWRVMPDSPLAAEEQQEWLNYRHYLRHLTDELPSPLGTTLEILDPPSSGGEIRVMTPETAPNYAN